MRIINDSETLGSSSINTIVNLCPPIAMQFPKHLLTIPIFEYNAEYLRQIGDFILRKINSYEFHKFPETIKKLKQKQQQFMELYERAKIEERKAKEKTCLKTQWPGYRPRLANKNDQSVFDRLSDKADTSKQDSRLR